MQMKLCSNDMQTRVAPKLRNTPFATRRNESTHLTDFWTRKTPSVIDQATVTSNANTLNHPLDSMNDLDLVRRFATLESPSKRQKYFHIPSTQDDDDELVIKQIVPLTRSSSFVPATPVKQMTTQQVSPMVPSSLAYERHHYRLPTCEDTPIRKVTLVQSSPDCIASSPTPTDLPTGFHDISPFKTTSTNQLRTPPRTVKTSKPSDIYQDQQQFETKHTRRDERRPLLQKLDPNGIPTPQSRVRQPEQAHKNLIRSERSSSDLSEVEAEWHDAPELTGIPAVPLLRRFSTVQDSQHQDTFDRYSPTKTQQSQLPSLSIDVNDSLLQTCLPPGYRTSQLTQYTPVLHAMTQTCRHPDSPSRKRVQQISHSTKEVLDRDAHGGGGKRQKNFDCSELPLLGTEHSTGTVYSFADNSLMNTLLPPGYYLNSMDDEEL